MTFKRGYANYYENTLTNVYDGDNRGHTVLAVIKLMTKDLRIILKSSTLGILL